MERLKTHTTHWQRLLVGLLGWLCAFFVSAQDTIYTYPDTIQASDLVFSLSEDDYLLQLVEQQSRALAARQDSLFQSRCATDTTFMDWSTGTPELHIGVLDSIRIQQQIQQMHGVHPLACRMYYQPIAWPSLQDSLSTAYDILTIRHRVRWYLTAHHADLYAGMYDSIEYARPQELRPDAPLTLTIPKALVSDKEEDQRALLQAIKDRSSLWRKDLTTMLQLTQNYITPNWYAGGNSNFAVLAIVKGNLKYDNHKNFYWESQLEWRLGMNTVSGDSLRKVNTNDDLFRIYTKAGLKAFNKFSYTLSAEFETHFLNTWETNSLVLKTGPLTPIRFNLSLGLDYKPLPSLSILLSPVTYKMVFAMDTVHVSPTAFGIAEHQSILNDVGSSIRLDWSYKPVREIALDSKLYFFTNYKRVEVDWEITCDFIINRFFSARLMLHPRYDNTVIRPGDARAKMQFKEMVSLGFSHKFY